MNDSPRGALVARLTEKGAAIDTQLLFFGLELAALEDEQADALLASDELEHWRHWLALRPEVPPVRPHRARGEDPHREVRLRASAPGTASTTSSSARSRSTSTGTRSGSRRRWRSCTRRIGTCAGVRPRPSPSRSRPGCARARSSSTRSPSTSRSTTVSADTRRGSRRATSRTTRPTRPCRR